MNITKETIEELFENIFKELRYYPNAAKTEVEYYGIRPNHFLRLKEITNQLLEERNELLGNSEEFELERKFYD